MKTEQIAKKAREYADDFLNRADNIFEWTCGYNGFEAGYEACNSEWQEKLRWKDMKDEIPLMGMVIEAKDIYKNITIWSIGLKSDLKYIKLYYTHWREVIE